MQRQVRAYKISKRFDCDISALCAGFAIELDGDIVKAVRLAYGGMAAIVKRAAQAEAALLGQPWTQASVNAAKLALAQDFKPLTDMRASADYRLQVAQNLLQRLWLETRAEDPLPVEATSVWSVMPHAVASRRRSLNMNKPIDPALLQSAEAFADYLKNTAARIDARAEAKAHDGGARVGISRPHESAHLHVAGEATYIDDIPELAGTLHCALGLSPVAQRPAQGHDARRDPRACPAWWRCSPRPTSRAATTAARSSTTTRSSAAATSATWASRCSR